MKPIFFAVSMLLLAACSPSQAVQSDGTTLIIVEYRYDVTASREIQHVLRLSRVSDWNVQKNGGDETIQARYKELAADKAREIEERLRRIQEVLHVEIRKDGIPARRE